MISFIIIGRNEGKKLKKCLESIYRAIELNNFKNHEIIYVDSKSSDDSVQVVSRFEEVKIFIIEGYCNAAVGRNIGAREASGRVLFFIDADMEISGEFLKGVFDVNGILKYDVVSGIVIDVVDGKQVYKRFTFDENSPLRKVLDGGIFLIKKQVWDSVNGMQTKYDTGEDGDLGLRLAAKGFQFVRINETITLHNTIPYLSKDRMWKFTMSKPHFCSRSVLCRNHIWNKYMYPRLWAMEKTFLFLIISIVVSFFLPILGLIFFLFYLLFILLRSIKQIKYVSLFSFFIYFLASDLLNLFYLFTYFPKNKEIQYRQWMR